MLVTSIGGHLVRYPWSAISDWDWHRNFRYRTEGVEFDIISDIGIKFYPISDIRHPISHKLSVIALAHQSKGRGFEFAGWIIFFLQCRISECALMSISEHFRYRNDVFPSGIFVSDIGITDVDVGCRISPTLRSMSMPTYGYQVPLMQHWCRRLGSRALLCLHSLLDTSTFSISSALDPCTVILTFYSNLS